RQLGKLVAAGAEVRTSSSVPVDALVVASSLVVLPREARVQGPCELALFQLPSVITATVELFDRVWANAVPWGSTGMPSERGLTEREKELLTLLSAGCTDLTVASRLGVSVRTVRRMMSDVMNRLGARSRFQAGVKAADGAWLSGAVGCPRRRPGRPLPCPRADGPARSWRPRSPTAPVRRSGRRPRLAFGGSVMTAPATREDVAMSTGGRPRTVLVDPQRNGACPTIGAAVSEAPDGAIVTIAAGTYAETLELINRRLTLRAVAD